MRQVAIIGAGMPALIVARTLLDQGARVQVFGHPDRAGVLSGMGPRHLWANVATREMAHAHDMHRVGTLRVLWLQHGHLTDSPTEESVLGYHVKARGVKSYQRPCGGMRTIGYIPNGWDLLKDWLDLPSLPIYEALVTDVHGGGALSTKYGTSMWDRIVTTLTPHQFFGMWPIMADRDIPKPTEVTYVWTSADPYHDDTLLYCGDDSAWWHRASKTSHGWCYESRPDRAPPEVTDETHRRTAATQLPPTRWTPPYPSWVIPVGRYAEWNNELLVSDVFANRGEYARRVLNGSL